MPKNKAVFQEKKYRYSWHIKSKHQQYVLKLWHIFPTPLKVIQGTNVSGGSRAFVSTPEKQVEDQVYNQEKSPMKEPKWVGDPEPSTPEKQDQEKDPVKEPRWVADQEPSNQYLTNKFEEQEENRVEDQVYDQEKDQVGGSKVIWRSRTFISTPEEGSRGGYSGESSGSLWSREGFSWRDEGEWEIKYIAYLKNKFGDQEVD